MSITSARICAAALALCFIFLAGCIPAASSQLDEEKEPHFLEGKSRINSMDYPGAIESFERALEANPKSASAHFELAWLYDQHEAEPAAAIYHYGHYLKLRPNGGQSDRAKARLMACKQELARSVALAPVAQNMQRDFDQLMDENKRLREEVEKWRTFYSSNRLPTGSSPIPATNTTPAQPIVMIARRTSPGAGQTNLWRIAHTNQRVEPGDTVAPRTYTVKTGDTPSAIARKYGVRLDALLAANPKVDPKRLQIGQILNLPAP